MGQPVGAAVSQGRVHRCRENETRERDIVGGRIQSGLAASLAERQALEREGEGMPFWHGVRLITFFIPEACVPRMIQAEHPSLRASEAA